MALPHGDPLTPFSPSATKYEILGVDRDAGAEDLKMAFRRAALLYHPDRHPEADRPLAEQIFKDVTAAYRTLESPEERQRYDRALARGESYTEASDGHGIRLDDVLADLQQYEHVFAPDALAELDAPLADAVLENLLHDLQEQVVVVYRLTSAPLHVEHRGTFKAGAAVVTNLRVLAPFTYTWEENDGSVRAKYTGLSAPIVLWPLVTRLVVSSGSRLWDDVTVTLQQADRSVAFSAGRQPFARLLVVATLWGIPIQTNVPEHRWSDLREAVARPWLISGLSLIGLMIVVGLIGWFVDAGFTASAVAVVAWAMSLGLAQAGVIGLTLWTAARMSRWSVQERHAEMVAALRRGQHRHETVMQGTPVAPSV